MERTTEYFPPELLNRLDSILVFNKLSRRSILDVVALRLKDVASRLKDRRITLDIDAEARNWLAEKGYSDIYGARAIARVVRTNVLFPLAQKLLRGTIRYEDYHIFLRVLTIYNRNGDVVHITVFESDSLDIKDNHPPDSSFISKEGHD
jgi:ATP-dependent Clp protease ATP-binding subunit ClpB